MNYAYVTLATNEKYLFYAFYLQLSLRIQKSKYPLIVMITENLKNRVKELSYFDKYEIIPHCKFPMESKRYIDTINKFYAYNLVQYDKLIWIDADVMLLQNIDVIFLLEPDFVCTTYNIKRIKQGRDSDAFFPHNVIMLFTPDESIYQLIVSNKDLYLNDEEVVKHLLYPQHFKTLCWDNKCNTFENLKVELNKPVFIHSKKLQTALIKLLHFTPQKLEQLNFSQEEFLKFLIATYQFIIKDSAGILITPQAILNFLEEQGSLKHHYSVGF